MKRLLAIPLALLTLAGTQPESGVPISAGELSGFVRDNTYSPGIKSGVGHLQTLLVPGFDLTDTPQSGATNFEHIMSGNSLPIIKSCGNQISNEFTPRYCAFPVISLGPDSARLTRDWQVEPWKIQTTVDYKLVAPHYLDVTWHHVFHNASLFSPFNWTGFFGNQYMNEVGGLQNVPIHFIGENDQWIVGDGNPPAYKSPWNQGGNYRYLGTSQLPYSNVGYNEAFNVWSYDDHYYTQPFYYGLSQHNLMFEVMFDRAVKDNTEIRFTIFKFNAAKFCPPTCKPAWDWQFIVWNPVNGIDYSYKMRIVVKPFVSQNDALQEFNLWQSTL